MLKIWGRATSSNVQKVLWACDEIGLPFERIDLGGPFGGLNSPDYVAKNPNARIPTIEDDGFVLWESNSILRYLARGNSGAGLLSTDPREAAIVDQWLDWQLVALGWNLRTVFMLLFRPGDRKPGVDEIAAANNEVAVQFTLLNGELAKRPFIAGDRFTIADIAAGISAHRWFALSLERPELPELQDWYERVSARPGFARIKSIPVV